MTIFRGSPATLFFTKSFWNLGALERNAHALSSRYQEMHFGGRRCKFGRMKGDVYLGKLTDEFVVKHWLLQAIKEDSQAVSNDLSRQFITLSQRIVATQTNVDALFTDVLHK